LSASLYLYSLDRFLHSCKSERLGKHQLLRSRIHQLGDQTLEGKP
jgi:hypothetical protein